MRVEMMVRWGKKGKGDDEGRRIEDEAGGGKATNGGGRRFPPFFTLHIWVFTIEPNVCTDWQLKHCVEQSLSHFRQG